MSIYQKISLFALRVSLGGLFLYAGISKVLDPSWSAAGYLKGAKTAEWLYQILLQPTVLPTINVINEWGLLLLGISLLLGLGVRMSSVLGAILMFFYYLPTLDFPMAGTHSFLIDEHIVYICALLLLGVFQAGTIWGLDKLCLKNTWMKRFI